MAFHSGSTLSSAAFFIFVIATFVQSNSETGANNQKGYSYQHNATAAPAVSHSFPHSLQSCVQTCLEICRIPARFRGWIPSLCRASEYDLRAESKTVFMWQNTGKTPPGCSLERSNSSPENQHAFSFFHCLYFLSCTGQNCFDIITEAI